MAYKGFDVSNDRFNLGHLRFETERRLKEGSDTEYESRTLKYVSGWLTRDAASVDPNLAIVGENDPKFNVGNSQTDEEILVQVDGEFIVDSYSIDYEGQKATITLHLREILPEGGGWEDEPVTTP